MPEVWAGVSARSIVFSRTAGDRANIKMQFGVVAAPLMQSLQSTAHTLPRRMNLSALKVHFTFVNVQITYECK